MRSKMPLLSLCFFLLMVVFVSAPETAQAQGGGGRSYYSNGKMVNRWMRYRNGDYYGMYYRYKNPKNAANYQHHMAYYFPKKGKYVYYYNPQTKKYWGRCPFSPSLQTPYEILNADDQVEKIDDVKENRFVKLTVNLTVTILVEVDGKIEKRQVVMSPSGTGMPPIPGTAGTADPEPMPPPPPAPDVAGWDWDS